MWTMLKRQYAVQKGTFAAAAAFMLGFWLLGIALHALIQKFAGPEEAVPVGTLLAALAGFIFFIAVMGEQVRVYFNLEVAMGMTRRRFFVTHFMVSLISALGVALLLAFLGSGEQALNTALYPGRQSWGDLSPYLWKWSVPAFLAADILAGVVGALILRFGKIVSWIVWGLWMSLCFIFPRLFDAALEKKSSLAGRIGNALLGFASGIPKGLWPLLLAAVCAAGLAGAWAILRRQQVQA